MDVEHKEGRDQDYLQLGPDGGSMSRKHGKSQLRCTQAQCELAALPGTGWRPDFFVGTQRPEERWVSVMACTLVFGPWVTVGSQAPCPESQGKDSLFQTSSVCGEASAVRGPALGGFRICKRLPALHAACPGLPRVAGGPSCAALSSHQAQKGLQACASSGTG